MRITPEILRKHAQVLVDKVTRKDRGIVAAYLQGSLLYGSPLLGGTGDIDLVFIHNVPPAETRQIIPLTPEIHFDIEHHDQSLYKNPRQVRLDPWLGPAIREAHPLYDPRHFLDYTQAGTRSNFDLPENIQARSKPLIEKARQFWMERQISPAEDMLVEFPAFLEALHNAANGIALLSGQPLPRRRLGRDFSERTAAIGASSLGVALNHMLGGVSLSRDQLEKWLDSWDRVLTALSASPSPLPLLVEKKAYYQAAMKSFLKEDHPQWVLWPLLTTWTEAVCALPGQDQLQLDWKKALTSLGFAGSDYRIRLTAFDNFLEMCESLIGMDTGEE
jgi:hypothetical protein